MILLLGGSGYVGTAFGRFFDSQSIGYRSVARNRKPSLRGELEITDVNCD